MRLAAGRLATWRSAIPWCRICRRPVSRAEAMSRATMAEIEVRTVCHGVPGRVILDELAIRLGDLRADALDVYELAPLMLEPIRPPPPPRKRGRPLPPEPVGFFRVLIPPPPEVRA